MTFFEQFSAELDANYQKPLFDLICIEFGTKKVERLEGLLCIPTKVYSACLKADLHGTIFTHTTSLRHAYDTF